MHFMSFLPIFCFYKTITRMLSACGCMFAFFKKLCSSVCFLCKLGLQTSSLILVDKTLTCSLVYAYNCGLDHSSVSTLGTSPS